MVYSTDRYTFYTVLWATTKGTCYVSHSTIQYSSAIDA